MPQSRSTRDGATRDGATKKKPTQTEQGPYPALASGTRLPPAFENTREILAALSSVGAQLTPSDTLAQLAGEQRPRATLTAALGLLWFAALRGRPAAQGPSGQWAHAGPDVFFDLTPFEADLKAERTFSKAALEAAAKLLKIPDSTAEQLIGQRQHLTRELQLGAWCMAWYLGDNQVRSAEAGALMRAEFHAWHPRGWPRSWWNPQGSAWSEKQTPAASKGSGSR